MNLSMLFPAWRVVLLYGCLLTGFLPAAHAQIKLGAAFGDHMVLPSNAPVSIWGSGCPGGDTVKLSIAGQSVFTRSDWQGRWMVRLAPMKAGGPFQMLIQIGGSGPLVSSSAANDHGGAEINDVLIGKLVVLGAAGLANAEVRPETTNTGQHPFAQVRVYGPGASAEASYSGHSTAQWAYVSEDLLPAGTRAYFDAGRDLNRKLHVPIGVVVAGQLPACAPAQVCGASKMGAPVSP